MQQEYWIEPKAKKMKEEIELLKKKVEILKEKETEMQETINKLLAFQERYEGFIIELDGKSGWSQSLQRLDEKRKIKA